MPQQMRKRLINIYQSDKGFRTISEALGHQNHNKTWSVRLTCLSEMLSFHAYIKN